MKAISVAAFGGPEVLQLVDIPAPVAGPGQVIIRVAYAGVNYAEILGRRNSYMGSQVPFTPGFEVAGYIHELGEGVSDLKIGQPVAALTGTNGGGYAEFTRASQHLTYPLPEGLDLKQAATIPTVVSTATALLTEVSRLQPGESVLILRSQRRCWNNSRTDCPRPRSRPDHRCRWPRRETRLCQQIRLQPGYLTRRLCRPGSRTHAGAWRRCRPGVVRERHLAPGGGATGTYGTTGPLW